MYVLVLFSANLHNKFDVHNFTHSKHMTLPQKQRSHVTLTTPIRGLVLSS